MMYMEYQSRAIIEMTAGHIGNEIALCHILIPTKHEGQ